MGHPCIEFERVDVQHELGLTTGKGSVAWEVCFPNGIRGIADDDPRTAEIVSKVQILERDREIQDPTILQQIAAR